MAFERSEYLYFSVLIGASLMLESVLTILLGALITFVSIHALILRTGADYERARALRLFGILLLITLASLSRAPFAPLLLVFAIASLVITAFEHVSVRGYLPVERA